MSDKVLRFLIAVAAVNGVICVAAPAAAIFQGDIINRSVGFGHAVYVGAVIALALTPVQLLFLWFVLGRRVRDMRTNRRSEIQVQRIIESESIDTAFQPIFDLVTRRVTGVEALARFNAKPTAPPDVWFAAAEKSGQGQSLELLAIRLALRNVAYLPDGLYIALNVSPRTLTSPELLTTLLDSGVPPNRLVVEVTEHASIPDYTPFQQARERLRLSGIRLAVDDAGSGYASFRHIVSLAPDIIKLDRGLIAGIDEDEARRALVAAVVMFALQSGAALLGEGVETAGELHVLETLGVEAAQGFHLGHPTTDRAVWATWSHPSTALSERKAQTLRPTPSSKSPTRY
jgi:EAL domain-containing protein (putative c-di-GMP-specific phosphodiesterase class I)